VELTRQRELLERIIGFQNSGSDPMADAVMTQPADRYVRADHFQREQSVLFSSLPLVVGASDDVRSPGDFFADDLSGRPLLIVRGDDGVLRGFHNSCGHRGASVESRDTGCSRRFTCPYHAWSYDNLGVLVSIPNDDGFADLDRSTRSLVELPVEERHGLVWAVPNAGPNETIDVGSFLGWGFAPFTGGVLSYIDMVGTKDFVAECEKLAQECGPRFAPPALLRDMAAKGKGFYQ